jgi:uncharacterized protein YndB with AHSA1/START domain
MTEEELRKEIVVDASPALVFKALTDEKELVKWMPTAAKMDARIGGEYEFKYHWADRNVDGTVRGKILELIPNKRLTYTWDSQRSDFTGPRKDSKLTWILDELPDGKTRITLIHSGIEKQFLEDTQRGWSHYLGQLVTYSKK